MEEEKEVFNEETSIIFWLKDKWIIGFDEEKGVVFNKKDFPEWTADIFANEFIKILESNFNIKFEKKGD